MLQVNYQNITSSFVMGDDLLNSFEKHLNKVLLITDAPGGATRLETALRGSGVPVRTLEYNDARFVMSSQETPSLIVAYLMKPNSLIFREMVRIREFMGVRIVVIAVGGLPEEIIVSGFKMGLDEIISHDIGIRELCMRVTTLLDRDGRGRRSPKENYAYAGFHVNPASLKVWKDGTPVALRRQESEILLQLVKAGGEVVSNRELMIGVWGRATGNVRGDLRNIISRLRKRFEDDPSSPRLILTVFGSGYRLDDQEN